MKRLDGNTNFDKTPDVVEYEDSNFKEAKDAVDLKNDNIDCPYEGCQKKLKGRNNLLKHICLIHQKKELQSKLIQLEGGKYKCPHCNLESMKKGTMISHYGIRHNVIIQFLVKNFPEHNVIKNT